jgi:drug/metabolite transporter (DMT)-like permease
MEQIEPITFNAARMALAAVAVGMVSAILTKAERNRLSILSKEEIHLYRRNTVFGGICCGTFMAAASIFQQMGIVHTTAGKAGFITAMYMLLVPVINFLLFKKRNSWIVWLAVLIGVVGMYLLCMDGSFRLTRGDTLVCICAVLFSGHILCCDHFVKLGNPIRISAIQFVTCTAISSVAALLLEQPDMGKILSAAIPILYCGIISGGLGYTLQIIAQKFTDPAIASLLMSLESVFAVIAGALILGERMSTRELWGCVIMFAAIILVQIRSE